MSYEYTDSAREDDDHALPDVEVFYADAGELEFEEQEEPSEEGWYFWYCFPGCLPDSEASGPYASEEEALAAAREMAGFCPHGVPYDGICEECPAPELWTLRREIGDGHPGTVFVPEYIADRDYTRDPSKASAWATESGAEMAASSDLRAAGFEPFRLPDDDARKWGRS